MEEELKFMRPVLLCFLLFIEMSVYGQEKSFELLIEEDSIFVNHDNTKGLITFQIQNNSKSKLIFYGLGTSIVTPPFPVMRFCQVERVSLGLALFLYEKDGSQLATKILITDSIDYKDIPKDGLITKLERTKVALTKDMEVIKPSENTIRKKYFDISGFRLNPGEYCAQLLYFSGLNITNYIDQGKIEIDMKENEAVLYHGCLLSNKFVIVVN